jgi:hypothetical protein
MFLSVKHNVSKNINRNAKPGNAKPGCNQNLLNLELFLSNKKNSYYVVTSTKCSCPSQTYRGGACKHMRKHFGAKAEAEQSTDSIMQDGQWPHGEHGPVPEILGGGGLVPQDKPEEEARPMSDEELEKECASKGLRCPD